MKATMSKPKASSPAALATTIPLEKIKPTINRGKLFSGHLIPLGVDLGAYTANQLLEPTPFNPISFIESLGLGEHGVTLGCSDGQRLQFTRPDETQNHWNVDEKTIPVTRDHIGDGERDPFLGNVIGAGFGCICEEFHRFVRQTADAAGTQRFAVF